MKTKKNSHKLELNRSTVTNLDRMHLNALKGGAPTWQESGCICPDSYSACDCKTTD